MFARVAGVTECALSMLAAFCLPLLRLQISYNESDPPGGRRSLQLPAKCRICDSGQTRQSKLTPCWTSRSALRGTELRVIRSAEKLQTKPGFWTEFTSEPDGVWVEKVRKTHLLMFPEPSAGAAGRCLSFCSIVLIRLTHVRRTLQHLSVSVPPPSLPHCPEYDPPWSRWGPGSSTNCSPNNCREL